VVLLPWTLRNYHAFDRLMFVRGGPYLELWLGNEPGRTGWMDLRNHPSVSLAESELFLEIGEQAYWDACEERFRADYRADPLAFWTRSLRRLGYAFVGNVSGEGISLVSGSRLFHLARVGLDVGVTSLAVAGFVVGLRRRWAVGWPAAIALSAAFPYLITHVNYRYLMPAKFMFLVLGAIAVVKAVERIQSAMRKTRSRSFRSGAPESGA
jgi:hypothetical protein